MENKEMNKNAPVELDDETLSAVSGGVVRLSLQMQQITEEAERRAQDPDAYYKNKDEKPY